jgi:hypothetical protein
MAASAAGEKRAAPETGVLRRSMRSETSGSKNVAVHVAGLERRKAFGYLADDLGPDLPSLAPSEPVR